MQVYIFSSNTITNIWAGIGAGMWAVQIYDKPEFKTRAMNMPIGSVGLIYCVESQSFTTPFIIKTTPEDRLISDIWPEQWMLPFNIQPFGTPRKRIHKDQINILPIVNESSKSWHHVLHIQSNLAFSPTHISEVDWEILIQELAD